MIKGEGVGNVTQHSFRHKDVIRVRKLLNDPVREKGSVDLRATIDHVSDAKNIEDQG